MTIIFPIRTLVGTAWVLRAFAAIAFLVSAADHAAAATVTATWDRNPETNVTGYILSYGTQSHVYSTNLDVGNVISHQLNLTAGQRYYFAVRAYNSSGQTSPYSVEVFTDLVGPPAPVITSLSPPSGIVGTSVTISGSNFGATQGTSVVRFNGTTAAVTGWSNTSIVATVPGGATTGPVVVTVNAVATNGLQFTVGAPLAPTLTSLSPASGAVGTAVTIAGANFGVTKGTSTVRFNGTTAATTSWSSTSILATVPSGATTGPVVVTVGGVNSNGVSFAVTSAAPSITNLSPTSGVVGTSVTIAGANFGTSQGTSTLRFNGTPATVSSWSATSIVAPVPVGATTGPVAVTVNGVASNGMSFTVSATSSLPAPWLTQDVGNPTVVGQASHASGTFTVSGAGADIWFASDQFRFVYQPLNGDGSIVARVASLQNTDPWAKAGAMIRQDLSSSAPHAMVAVTPGNGIALQGRATPGGTSSHLGVSGLAPQWVRLVRAGNTFSGYYSANGTAWTLISTVTASMPPQVYVGLVVTSHNPSVAAAATFTNVSVTGGAPPPNQAPILTQPANQTNAEGASVSVPLAASDPDGNPLTYTATGLPAALSVHPTTGVISGTLTFTSAGSYTVTATASDGPLSNSKTFTWTVTDVPQAPTITSLSPTSGAVGTAVTIAGANFGSSQGTSTVRFNGTTATPTSWNATIIVAAVPSGATTGPVVVTVNGVASNGPTFNISAPAPNITSLSPTSGVVSTAVTIAGANFGSSQGTSTVRFNGTTATPTSWSATSITAPVPSGATTGPVVVTVNGVVSNGVSFTVSASGSLPAPWTTQDIGNPALPGQATFASGTFSVSGGGVDIWDTNDQFRFVYQPLNGNGEIVARVTSLQYTDYWAKAGLMIREDLASNAPNVVAQLSGGGGTTFQWRTSRGGTSSFVGGFPASAPRWVRLVRAGNTFSGYYSADGTAWTLMSTTTVAMPAQVYIGLSVTSHNASVTTTGTFTNVSVAAGSLPAPWTTQDIGNPALTGQATFASGTFSVSGGGIDIWHTNDQFRFVYQPLAGDGEILARVASLQNTDAWAKAGVMIRQSLTANSPHAMVAVTPANGAGMQRRTTSGGVSAHTAAASGPAPLWTRLVRAGNTFRGYYSANGTAWTLMDTITIAMPAQVYVGLVVTSHNPSAVAAATFTNVTATFGSSLTTTQMTDSADQPASASAVSTINDRGATEQARALRPPANSLALRDYDGDGRVDLAAYRPSTGDWQIVSSLRDYQTGSVAPWGSSADLPVPGDYDGDRRTDLAIYRPVSGMWSVRSSSNGATLDVMLGANGDVPVPGDYDGDGKTDLAVYSPSTGQWRTRLSATGYATENAIPWGSLTDLPVPGDYDGDGRTDPAVYRPSTGEWKILRSSADFTMSVSRVLGTATDIPVPADYDGDGVTDVAVFDPSTGKWHLRSSSTSETAVVATLGARSDVPLPGDYDGDGRADLSVFHAGTWQILYSSLNYTSGVEVSWAQETDIPLPRQP